jgi:hypothetical protein
MAALDDGSFFFIQMGIDSQRGCQPRELKLRTALKAGIRAAGETFSNAQSLEEFSSGAGGDIRLLLRSTRSDC